jgi:mannose-6-phosphate isomerase-like protein (cupin superfamily)
MLPVDEKSAEPINITSPEGIEKVNKIFDEQEINDFPLKPPDDTLQQSWLSGDLYTYLKTAEDTGGEYSLFDFVVPPQSGALTHLHNEEDEVFKVVQGEVTFQQGNKIDIAGPGDIVVRPRGNVHRFKNLGAEPARILFLDTPSGIEHFFTDGGQPVTDQSLTPAKDDQARVEAAGKENDIIYYPEVSLLGTDKLTPGTAPLDGNDGITIYGDNNNESFTGQEGDDLYLGADGNDNLSGVKGEDIFIGEQGNDILSGGEGNDILSGREGVNTSIEEGIDTLTGGAGRDAFYFPQNNGIDIVTDFGGVGTDENLSSDTLGEVDVLKFEGSGLIAKNLFLTQEENDLVINFEGVENTGVRLQNFSLENLENFETPTVAGTSTSIGNILFDGQRGLTDLEENFDVFDTNQQSDTVLRKNSVTFLNDLDNNTTGFEDSNDVINGQGGNDYLSGLSGDDLLRGGYGDDIIVGGYGDDLLRGDNGSDSFVLNAGEGNDTIMDFTDGQDTIQISSQLNFSALKITQGVDENTNDVSISIESKDELLATISGVQANNITSDDISFS